MSTLYLWHYLENYERILQTILPKMKPDETYDEKKSKLMRAFGRRLARLFKAGTNKFHPTLTKLLQVKDHCGIYLYSLKPKSVVLKRLDSLGWPVKRTKILFIKQFPKQNYFDQMCTNDVVVFMEGVIPTEIDFYCLSQEEINTGKKKGIIQKDHSVFLLDKYQQTFILNINVFKLQAGHDSTIVGIGGSLKEVPDWYKAVEALATERIFDPNDQPILANISKFYAEIGCFIPYCVGFGTKNTRYWHLHNDPDHPRMSIQNYQQSKNYVMIDFGLGYNVKLSMSNGKERRIVVPIELYGMVFGTIDSALTDKPGDPMPESNLYLFQSPNGRYTRLEDTHIISSTILSRYPLRTLEDRRNLVATFHTSLVEQSRPNLVLISPKGSFKTTFTNFLQAHKAPITIIDSDDYGVAITRENAKLNKEEEHEVVHTGDENFIIRWFRQKFSELEIGVNDFPVEDFDKIKNLSIQIDEFSEFWKRMFDKGLGDIPSFNNYIAEKIKSEENNSMAITLTHNLFEARLCQSKSILVIDCGIDPLQVITKRAVDKNKTVASFLADELYQKYCLSSKDLHHNVVGWGDILVALIELGQLSVA